DLSVGNIERCRGFSSHLFKLLLRQRHRLAKLTEQWVSLRKLTNDVQDIKAHLQTQGQDTGCTLPPQDSLQGWFKRGQVQAAQCATLLQQLSWLLQCCPEDPQQKEQTNTSSRHHTLMCPSPLAVQQQPAGCLLRRGDPGWCQLHQQIIVMLKDFESLKEQLGSLAQRASERVLCTWSSFATCCSAMEQLGGVAAQISSIEQLFSPVIRAGRANGQPAIIQSLQYVRGQVEICVTEFTTWKTQLLSLGQQPTDQQSAFCTDFSAELEANISAVLYAVQKIVKRRQGEQEREQHGDSNKDGAEEDIEKPVEDLLKPGHLTRLLEEELEAEVEALSVGNVNAGVSRLLICLRRHRNSCHPPQLQEVNRACRMLVGFEPLLGVYSDLVRYYLSVSVGVHRSTGKLLSVLSIIFTDLAQKGFCLPQELMSDGDGEGATEFHDYEGGGVGEGDGTKDVSNKVENEDQVEDTFQEGTEKEEQQDKENIKAEDNAIEMSEDFDGRVHDGDENEAGENEESDEEDKEELDKKMGDLGDGQTDNLDERMWGDDDEEVGSDEEEESGQGMDQGESELVAKEDNLDAADSNTEKKSQDKDEQICEEETEKINEQGDEREFDENEVDPYHGQQDKRPEPEAMELPEDLNLDQDEEAGEDEECKGDGEDPLDIDDKAMEQEVKEERGGEEGEPGETEMEENQIDDENNPEPKAKEEDDKAPEKGEEEAAGEDEEKEGEDNREAQEEKEDMTVPNDNRDEPKQEDEGEKEHNEQPISAERKEHSADGQTGEENIQSDTAVELAGAASERDQAKEEHGSGAADASQSEGHQSKLTARMTSQTQTQSKTQSFKRKPGQADNERSTGDYNERINKRLRTVESSQERTENRQTEGQQESELYEHIKHGDTAYDTQTYDVANSEQQKAAGPLKDQNEDENDEVAMEKEDQEEQLQSANVEELKPDQLNTSKFSQKGVESGDIEMQWLDKEDERLKDQQQPRDEEQAARSTESTIHTVPAFLFNTEQKPERDPEELRKEMELQLEAWRKLASGTQEEEAAAASMWLRYQALTSALSQQLCEQLRLILEPTQAAKLRGDYRTGKRLNMRKVIPYIASQYRKDKIWLRRTKPSKREYQICLAMDDSSSMVDNHSKQ
ncbi:hypothetical protein XENORESO_006224, partial [Xenotaenia resolanae]